MPQNQNKNKNDNPSRRGFLRTAAAAASAAGIVGQPAFAASTPTSDIVAEYLKKYVVPKNTIDQFLDPEAHLWAKFDPTYGYLLRDAFIRDGVDGARTLGRYENDGPRRQVNFPDAPCRINTYGDSFTQGHQVSDGETWQEVLAAHYCEPIRNYGIGGFGVYQAYRRMLENEATDEGADHLILNIWGDDHHRSIYACRWLSFPPNVLEGMLGTMFHANPWVHTRLDPQTGELIEMANACPSADSLYQMTDADWMINQFGADPVTHALVAVNTGEIADRSKLDELASACGYTDFDASSPPAVTKSARMLMNTYAIRVGMKVVDAANEFALANGKRLFVLLSHPSGSVWRRCAGESPGEFDWHPQVFLDYLNEAGIPFIDTVEAHAEDFKRFNGSPKEYVDSYYIGHYTPTGNHFFAYAVKDQIAAWLDPPPPAYANAGHETLVRFEGYLAE